jgi:hypothetical protein
MIRIDDVRRFDRASPTEKLLALVFAIAAKDRASEVRFDYRQHPSELRLWYWVEDRLVETVRPPTHIWPGLVRIILKNRNPASEEGRTWWGLFRRGHAFPDFPLAGSLPVRFGNTTVEFDVLLFRGRTGEHIWLEKEPDPDVSLFATEFLQKWHLRRGSGPDSLIVELK